MKTHLLYSLLIGAWISAASPASAATLPAGTAIIVRTNGAISTHATPGNHFTAVVDQSVTANGSVVLPGGTPVTGLIRSSRGSRSTTSSSPLTLVLTGVSSHGKIVKIKTDSLQPQGAKTTRARRGGFSFGEDVFPAGTRLEFRLAHSANL